MATLVRQIMVASLLVGAIAVRAGSCDGVVEATIEEMRAGAGKAITGRLPAAGKKSTSRVQKALCAAARSD